MESIELELDPGQKDILDDGLSMTESGLWVASEIADIEPRQNGKTLTLEARALAGAYLLKEPLIVWTAHEFKTATRSFLSLKEKITNWDFLRKRVRSIRQSGATTEIELFNPTRTIAFLARSGGSGRGFAQVSPLFLDEAYALSEEQLAAIIYAMSAAPNPQVWYGSSAPLTTSTPLREICARGQRGSRTMIYYEWSASGTQKELEALVARNKKLTEEEEATPEGQLLREKFFAKTAEANRAFRRRISETTVLRNLAATGVEQFLREQWGVFSLLEAGGKLDPEKWEALADAASRRKGEVAIGVDIAVEREWAAIGMYGKREDGLGHVQLIDFRPNADWVMDALVKLREVLDPIAIGMARGTHASLKVRLKEEGFLRPEDRAPLNAEYRQDGDPVHPPERGDLIVMNGTDMAAACGRFIDSVKHGTMRHVPSDQLTSAARVGQTRVVGDAMAWTGEGVTALVAVTEAQYAFEERVGLITEYDPANDLF